MVIQYKCPACGSDLAYDIEKDAMACPHCKTVFELDQLPEIDVPEGETDDEITDEPIDGLQVPDETDYSYKDNAAHEPQMFDERAVEFFCQNCGAVIVSDENTAATWCHYCDAPVVLKERLSGQMAPTYVIPFRVTKEEAQKAFENWSKKGLFTPKKFRDAKKLKSVQGIYVPFWLYDVSSEGTTNARATKVRRYTRGDYIYTETRHFNVFRRARMNYIRVPADASEKMNDNIMNLLEPYHYNELQVFQTPFLAGFYADKYSYKAEDMYGRVRERIDGFVKQYIRGTINGYTTVHYQSEVVNSEMKHADYTMLPVWIFCYDYNDAEHMFAMNGQTGKIVGTLPVDKKRVMGFGSLFAGGGFVALMLVRIIAALITYFAG